ncbi:paraquat-inducible protein A [Pseudoalteromonas sp. MMG012]|uniref:paraquat-inducible protein A n=1 Tax=Pseudoalteromonas sp. MMG012 TaxID=2822686 RepID=UPI001B39F613|nr:paraquat-inducible protein A [Pseudoalteromonas sp. MMG012]MBQ4849642.1 paraquat-inducible protein A [Pseudoalteromonas sp. MMG012]
MILACKQCDRLVNVAQLGAQQRANCPNCNAHLITCRQNLSQWNMAFAVTSLLFLFASLYPSFISFSQHGLVQEISLWQACVLLSEKYNAILAGLFLFTILIMPVYVCTLTLISHSKIWSTLSLSLARKLTKSFSYITPLNLADIFLVAVLVSAFKLMSLAELSLGYGFWAYVLFVICFIELLTLIDESELWERQQCQFEPVPHVCGQTAMLNKLRQCHICNQLSRSETCPRCEAKTYFRKPKSIERASVWMLTALILLIPANFLPIMDTINLGQHTPATIFSGIVIMWESGSYPIATIIFVASICIPIIKAILLFYLIVQTNKCRSPQRASQLYRLLEIIGKWSMIDVFVVIVLVSLVQLGNVLTVEPQLGIVFFTAMVLCQMIAVHSFDPRILWDKYHAYE